MKDTIKKALTSLKEKLTDKSIYFRLGVLACLIISVLHGVHLFETSNVTAIGPVDLSILISATVDIGIWFLIDALVYTRKRQQLIFSLVILFGITLLCLLSFLANYSYNQHFYSAQIFSSVDGLDKHTITLLQSSPPLIIIFLSIVGEIFIRPDKDEELDYEEQMKKRYMRPVHKKAAKLYAKQKMQEVEREYTIREEHNTAMLQTVKWSFFGFTVYNPPVAQPKENRVDESLKQISIHLENNVTNISQQFCTLLEQKLTATQDSFNTTIQRIEQQIETQAHALETIDQKLLEPPRVIVQNTDKVSVFDLPVGMPEYHS